MPVTAKLSRNFYERLGDEVAGELVDWFNSVDTEYQRQYREANDLNWERFKTELHAQGSELRAEMRTQATELRAEMRTQATELHAEMRAQATELRLELGADISRVRTDLMKWMFIYWTGTMMALAAFVLTTQKP